MIKPPALKPGARIAIVSPASSFNRAEFDLGVAEIRRLLETETSIDRVYQVELKSADGVVHAVVDKTIYIRRSKG